MIIRCTNCDAKMTANSKLGCKIECVKCRRWIAVTPSFDEIPELGQKILKPKVTKSPVIREVVEVEVETVPFWLMLFQGIQIACLLAVIVYMWLPSSEREYRQVRDQQARQALQEKEKREAIKDPFMQKYKQWKTSMRSDPERL